MARSSATTHKSENANFFISHSSAYRSILDLQYSRAIEQHRKGTAVVQDGACKGADDAESGEVSLIISDPAAFWEQTKYLVIQTN